MVVQSGRVEWFIDGHPVGSYDKEPTGKGQVIPVMGLKDGNAQVTLLSVGKQHVEENEKVDNPWTHEGRIHEWTPESDEDGGW